MLGEDEKKKPEPAKPKAAKKKVGWVECSVCRVKSRKIKQDRKRTGSQKDSSRIEKG